MNTTRRTLFGILAAAPVVAKVKPALSITAGSIHSSQIVNATFANDLIAQRTFQAEEICRLFKVSTDRLISERIRNASIETIDTGSNEV